MEDFVLATTHGAGRYANAAVLTILGLFLLFMAFAVSTRTSVVANPDDPVHVDPNASPDDQVEMEWLRAERRRARVTRSLRPLLVVLGVAMLVGAALAALVTWI